jgi:flagellar FliJ protein
MRRFRFRLETLLQMRRRREEEIKLRLAAKNSHIIKAQEELGGLHAEMERAQKADRESRTKALQALALRQAVVYRHRLKADIAAKNGQIDGLRNEAEEIRRALVVAKQKTRAVELLREKRQAQWRKEYNANDQKFTDDISQQQFVRARRAAAAPA